MVAHFIDVGQGAAALFEFPCGAVLIDTGGQDQAHVDALTSYLEDFFQDRPDLNRTIKALFITHPHIDHTRGIEAVATQFNVENYLDDGITTGSGSSGVTWVRDHGNENGRHIQIREVNDSEITALPQRVGLTDSRIDPVSCTTCDPKIRVLSARLDSDPGWGDEAFGNANNQSLVVRIDFGEASFLVTGDLEEPAIETLVDYYAGIDTLDVDVYEVGHHGSYNGTTPSLLTAMSPAMAVIGVGNWQFGQDGGVFTTYRYGHPRLACIQLLEASVSGTRPLKSVKVATASRTFVDRDVTKAIYATGWDGTVLMTATLQSDPVVVVAP